MPRYIFERLIGLDSGARLVQNLAPPRVHTGVTSSQNGAP